MPLAMRGVIEGFYGPPHRHGQRLRTVAFLAEVGMNTYLFAPKDTAGHRDRWREGHLAVEWDRLADLRRAGASVGVDVWFGLSPLGLDPDHDPDLARLLAIFDTAIARGFRHLCLLVDDMPPGDWTDRGEEALARVHADLVNTWADHLRTRTDDGLGLLFVPLHYHGDPRRGHVRVLGRRLDPDVGICWTGPEVCSEYLSADHTAAISASLRRPVVYWDNHPVNDGPMRGDPHVLPFVGREPGLAEHAGGLLANLAIEPEASLPAVATVADFCRDPVGYDPDASWAAALERVTGDPADARAVTELARLTPRSPIRRPTPLPPDLVEAVARLRTSPVEELPVVVGQVAGTCAALGDTVVRLARLDNTRLAGDLAPWIDLLAAQHENATRALGHLTRALDHRDVDPEPDLLDDLEALGATPHRVADGLLVDLARACLAAAERATGD